MAERNPNERRSSTLIEKPDDAKTANIVLPPEVAKAGIGTGNGQYYGYRVVYANGRSEIEWYKRGSGGGPDQPDPVALRSEAPPAADIKEAWDKGETAAATAAGKKEVRKFPGTDPGTGLPAIVTEYEDGSYTYDSTPRTATAAGTKEWRTEGTPDPNAPGGFDNSRPTMAAYVNGTRTGETRPPTAKELEDWNLAAQMTRNPGGKTDAEVQADADRAARGVKPVRTYTGTDPATNKSATVTEYSDGTKTYAEAKPGAGKPVRTYTGTDPATGKSATVTEYDDGTKIYTEAKPEPVKPTEIRRNPDTGQDEEVIRNPDGTVKETRPLPRNSTTEPRGPARPNMIVGHTAAALRQYGEQLDAQVAAGVMTPAQRRERWNEAIEIAPIAINEATLAQRAAESNLNASVQLANNRLSNSTSGFNAALSAISDLNGKLPIGSNLGGKAFIALLGLQVMQADRMGANDIRWPQQTPTGASLDAANAATSQTTQTAIGDVLNQPPAAPAPAVDAAPAPPLPPIFAPPPPVAGSVAIPAAAPATPPPATAPVAPPPGAGNTGQVGDPRTQPPAINPVTGEPTGLTPLPGEPGFGVPPAPPPTVPFNPPSGQPGHVPGAPVGQQQPAQPDFAVLQQARQQTQQPIAPPIQQPPMPAVLMRTQAAVTVPWHMSPEEYARYKEAGIDDATIWGVPGRVA